MGELQDRFNALVAGPEGPQEPEGRGPLAGWRVAVKDDTDVAGLPTRHGSRLSDAEPVSEDAPLTARLRAEGAMFVGKTNLSEFALFAVTDNALTGATGNPWDPGLSPGGSSGGSAVAVAVGLADAATGTDAGGSVRIPAAFTGTVGLKPTRGRFPHEPSAIYGDREHPGFLTRSVGDARRLLQVAQGSADPADAPPVDEARIGWSTTFGYATVTEEVEAMTQDAVGVLRPRVGAVVPTEVTLPDPGPTIAASTGVEARAFLEDRYPGWREQVWRPTEAVVDAAPDDPAPVRWALRDLETTTRDRLDALFEEVDVLVTPTTAVPAFPQGRLGVREVRGVDVGPLGWMPFTVAFNLTGGPAVSVPVGTTAEGVPLGVQIAGPPGGDHVVLDVAEALEEGVGSKGWWER